MKTAVIGFPRIGEHRELKFALEKYFRREISQQELFKTAGELREKHWREQQSSGIDYIPSGDFSLYDQVLDTAVLFNIIPQRFRDLNLSELDTLLAMARGCQDEKSDVKALGMKKWFTTNYHYIVPEIDRPEDIHLAGTKISDEYAQAKASGVETRPSLVGIFTFLNLCNFAENARKDQAERNLVQAYRELLGSLEQQGVSWISLEEPWLCRDLSPEEVEQFTRIYRQVLSGKKEIKVNLQTYFGDIRDVYQQVMKLPFDGVGLDFLEGRENLKLVEQYGFPEDRVLFAGVVSGRNIWRNSYSTSLGILKVLQDHTRKLAVSSACSLLHVPYTVAGETSLSKEHLKHFAFAREKLRELGDLKTLMEDDTLEENRIFLDNCALFTVSRNVTDQAVQQRMAKISSEDFIRVPDFEKRAEIQKNAFNLPLFPTTTIGSFPQTSQVKHNRLQLRKNLITREEYDDEIRQHTRECIRQQEELDLDVLVHGEFERNDMVEYFGQHLRGFLFTQNGWVQSYGTRCVKPPVIWGDVSRSTPVTVDMAVFAQSLSSRPVKGMLTGPVTILNWSFPREDVPLRESALQIALAVRDEVLDLEKAGIRIIQVDEAALREKLPVRKSLWFKNYLDWAIPAFRLVHSGVKPQTQIHTHMCYSEFTDIIPSIDNMDADVITFEASRSDLHILSALKENNFRTEVGPGVYDIHSPRIPSVSEIKTALQKILEYVPLKKLWVNPDCGLKTRSNEETWPSLRNMVSAAKELRNEYK